MASLSKAPASRYRPVASTRHLIIMLLIQASLVAFGFYLQHRPSTGDSVLPENRNVIPFYLSVIALEWGLVASVRGAVKVQGLSLWDITGGRWTCWKDVMIDALICVPFLFLWNGAAWLMHRILGPDESRSITTLLPRTTPEILLWVVVSISAGVCEEIVFRGYFQKQLASYTRSMSAAIVLQGIIFGIGHSYQGVRQVMIIAVLGVIYGCLATWRRNLRVNMIAHAWSDVWGGWLSGALR